MKIEDNYVFPVYINQSILDDIRKLCHNSSLEIFGYLVGEIFKWDSKKYVLIEDHIYIKGAVHSDQYSTAQIEGTAGKYEKQFQKLKSKKGKETLRIVGWWHSHPGFTCFLSSTDIATQEFFFPESHQVALVVDPLKEDHKFFTLDNKSSKKYKEISSAIISDSIS